MGVIEEGMLMTLMIKKQGLSWNSKFDVYDEQGNLKYYVKKEGFSIGHKLHVFDRFDNEIGLIREKIFSFPRDFEVIMKDVSKGLIMADVDSGRQKYYIDFNEWKVNGDSSNLNYEVYSDEMPIICIKKEMSWADTYTVDIENPEDEVIALMLVIAINIATHYFKMISSLVRGNLFN